MKKVRTSKAPSKKEPRKAFWMSETTHGKFANFLADINDSSSEYSKVLGNVIIEDFFKELSKSLTPKLKESLRASRIDGAAELEVYKRKYFELHKGKSERDWHCFIMSSEFSKFRKDHISCIKDLMQ